MMRTFYEYHAICTLCKGTGWFIDHECTVCKGVGVNILITESEPVLTRIFQMPEHPEEQPQKRITLFDLDETNPEKYWSLHGPLPTPEGE